MIKYWRVLMSCTEYYGYKLKGTKLILSESLFSKTRIMYKYHNPILIGWYICNMCFGDNWCVNYPNQKVLRHYFLQWDNALTVGNLRYLILICQINSFLWFHLAENVVYYIINMQLCYNTRAFIMTGMQSSWIFDVY